jgi:hypothetical protein
MTNEYVHIKSITLIVLLVGSVLVMVIGNLSLFDKKTNAYNYAYAIVVPNKPSSNSTALDYGIGKNAGSIAAVHDFSALNGYSKYNPRINQGSSNYRVGYSVGYNDEWKQLSSAANSSITTSSLHPSSSSLPSSYQKIQHYLVNGTQSLNYTSIGQSLSCTDLNESSPHGAVLAATLNCGSGAVNSHREGMPTTSHSLVTPTTAPQFSVINRCDSCVSKDNSIDGSSGTTINNNQGNDNAHVPSFSSPLPGIIPPSP